MLGILVMNIQSFSMIGAAYVNPHAYGDLTGANYGVWFLSHLLADSKFMTIFSLLFGAGVVLMATRREASGRIAAALEQLDTANQAAAAKPAPGMGTPADTTPPAAPPADPPAAPPAS